MPKQGRRKENESRSLEQEIELDNGIDGEFIKQGNRARDQGRHRVRSGQINFRHLAELLFSPWAI